MARLRKKKGMTEVVQPGLFDREGFRSWRIEFIPSKDEEGNPLWAAMLLNSDGDTVFETPSCASKDYVRMEALKCREELQQKEFDSKEVK